MRGSIWGSVAVIVAVLAGAAYLPRASAVRPPAVSVTAGGTVSTVVEVRDGIATGRAAAAVSAMTLEARVRLARAAAAARRAALIGSERTAPAAAWLRQAALDVSVRATMAARALRREPAAAVPAALATAGLILAAAAGGVWARLGRRCVPLRAVRRLARRGEACARIARRTQLAQDAVRSLVGGSACARGSLERGKDCRPAPLTARARAPGAPYTRGNA